MIVPLPIGEPDHVRRPSSPRDYTPRWTR
jgi:hypothetical protein